jgi:hypothetical protein
MISSASSFQRRQPHPVSITLAPGNPRRTFAFTKFRRTFRRAFPAKPCTSSANGHRYEVYFVELNDVMWWIARFRCRLRHLPQLRRVTPATPLQLRWALPSPSFLTSRRWAHHRVGLVDLVPFFHSRACLEVVPIESLSPFLSLFCYSHHDRGAVRRVPAAIPAASDCGHLLHSLPQVRISTNSPSSSPSVLHLVRSPRPPPPPATRTPRAPLRLLFVPRWR